MEIAILLATYNSEHYLKQQVDSILNQSYENFVCYFHDDGSLDSTQEIIDDYCEAYPERMKKLEYPAQGGAKKNFMSMLNYVEEKYVMFCDHDDYWLPNKIEKSIEAIKKIESKAHKAVLVFSDLKVVNEDLSVIHESFMKYSGINPNKTMYKDLLIHSIIPGCSLIMNREVYTIARKCHNPSNIKMHDNWCALIASALGEVAFLNESLILYRQHGNNELGAIERRSFLQKVLFNIKKVLQTDFIHEKKEWIEEIRRQAYELSLISDIPEDVRSLSRELHDIKNQSKIKRILFCCSNKIGRKKYDLWLMLWF